MRSSRLLLILVALASVSATPVLSAASAAVAGNDKAKSDKDKADKAKADKEKADKAKADQEKADKAKADQEKADKEKADKAKADKEKADKAKADQDKADKAPVPSSPSPTGGTSGNGNGNNGNGNGNGGSSSGGAGKDNGGGSPASGSGNSASGSSSSGSAAPSSPSTSAPDTSSDTKGSTPTSSDKGTASTSTPGKSSSASAPSPSPAPAGSSSGAPSSAGSPSASSTPPSADDSSDDPATDPSDTTNDASDATPGPGLLAAPLGSVVLDPPAPPVAGETLNATPVSGTVVVRLPGSKTITTLDQVASLPTGTTVDATQGGIAVVTAAANGTTQTGAFAGGMFVIRQVGTTNPMTEIALARGDFSVCDVPVAARAGASAARARKSNGRSTRVVRALWGRDNHGRFRTKGRDAVATVRGTAWLTQDRCDGTLTYVMEGAVSVYDKTRQRTVTVTAGHTYLARRP